MTRRLDVVGVVLLLVAVAVGVWIGLNGPDLSPVFTDAPFGGGPGGGDVDGGRRG
jgi:hypothetical protein